MKNFFKKRKLLTKYFLIISFLIMVFLSKAFLIPSIVQNLISIELLKGFLDDSVKDSNHLNRAEKLIQIGTSLDPKNIEIWRAQGKIEVELGDYGQAAASYSKLPLNSQGEEINWLRTKGWNLLGQGKNEEAGEIFKLLIKWQPDIPDGYLGLGVIYEKAQKWKEALDVYNEYSGSDMAIALARGKANLYMNENYEAIFWSSNVLASDSPSLDQRREAYLYRGLALSELNRHQESDSDFINLIDTYPVEKRDWRLYTAYLELGQHKISGNLLKDAMMNFEKAVETADGSEQRLLSTFWLGQAYLLNGDLSDAENSFKKIIRVNPEYWQAHLYLGKTYLQQRLYLDAKNEISKVLSVDPDNPEAKNLLNSLGE